MNDPMLPLSSLSPVSTEPIVARFDGGHLSSDAGVLVLREIAERLGIEERLASCIDDPRDQSQVHHTLAAMRTATTPRPCGLTGFQAGARCSAIRLGFGLAVNHLARGKSA